MQTKIIQIGKVCVDSAKLMIVDPLYLHEWNDNGFQDIREYEDTQNGCVYVYGKDFKKYSEILFEQKTVNELLAEGRLKKIPFVGNDFSHNTLCHQVADNRFAQLHFEGGGEGIAVAFSCEPGDGEYPVFAELNNEDFILKVWVDFEKYKP